MSITEKIDKFLTLTNEWKLDFSAVDRMGSDKDEKNRHKHLTGAGFKKSSYENPAGTKLYTRDAGNGKSHTISAKGSKWEHVAGEMAFSGQGEEEPAEKQIAKGVGSISLKQHLDKHFLKKKGLIKWA